MLGVTNTNTMALFGLSVLVLVFVDARFSCGNDEPKQSPQQGIDADTVDAVSNAAREAADSLEGMDIKTFLCQAKSELLEEANLDCNNR